MAAPLQVPILQPAVHSDLVMIVTALTAVHPQASQAGCQTGIIGDDHAAVAGSAEVLGGVEAITAHLAKGSGHAAAGARAQRLSGILNDGDAAAACHLHDLLD